MTMKKRKKRPTASEAEATRRAVVMMLRRNPMLNYSDGAKAAGLSKQRIGQIAAEEPGLEEARQKFKDELVARLGGRIRLTG
jgi:hypothetical protein